MSSFNGKLLEIPQISIDHFDNNDQQFYFLSHLHSDHLKGIEKLVTNSPFFASPISSFIIKKKYPHLQVEELEVGYSRNLEIINDDGSSLSFVVTSISAGHCMGACMFLFQIEGTDILYTGDIRISLDNAKNIKLLKEVRDYGNLVLYLDSTFMKSSYAKFPSQRESIAAIITVIKNHLDASSSHKVYIQGSARYGYERVFMEVSKHFNEKIYVCEEETYEQYAQISEINRCITRDILNARIFLKPKFLSKDKSSERNVLNLNLSAMYWENWNEKSMIEKLRSDYFRVCYATHSSCEEISDLLTYLKPKKVNLNVIPDIPREKFEMFRLLRDIQKKYMPTHDVDVDQNEEEKVERKFSFKRLRTNATVKTDKIPKKQKYN